MSQGSHVLAPVLLSLLTLGKLFNLDLFWLGLNQGFLNAEPMDFERIHG